MVEIWHGGRDRPVESIPGVAEFGFLVREVRNGRIGRVSGCQIVSVFRPQN